MKTRMIKVGCYVYGDYGMWYAIGSRKESEKIANEYGRNAIPDNADMQRRLILVGAKLVRRGELITSRMLESEWRKANGIREDA